MATEHKVDRCAFMYTNWEDPIPCEDSRDQHLNNKDHEFQSSQEAQSSYDEEKRQEGRAEAFLACIMAGCPMCKELTPAKLQGTTYKHQVKGGLGLWWRDCEVSYIHKLMEKDGWRPL